MAEDMEITEVSETEPQTASSLSQEERERIAQLPYEQARDELIQAVRALENGGLSLEDSMKQWELGEALAPSSTPPTRRRRRRRTRRGPSRIWNPDQ